MNDLLPATPERRVVEWVRSRAIPLATVEPRHGWADLEALRSIVGDARILSLGEATHGTREFFKLKHRILEFCVAELGFTTFIIEAPFAESLAVNAYVREGVGNAAEALAGLRFWVWNTEEVLDLIEWMRWWNRGATRQVTFYGYTMSDTTAAAHGLIDFLSRVSPELAAACERELAPLTSDLTAGLLRRRPVADRDAIFARIGCVLTAFEHQRTRWIAATSAVDWQLGRLHAVVLDQSARHRGDGSSTTYEREVADNVCALLEMDGPGAKAVLWSHNVHAARAVWSQGDTSMGMWLDHRFGREQVVVGFSFDRGAFQARTFPTGNLADHSVPSAASGTFDHVLAQAGLPLFALDLAADPHDAAAAAWLSSETTMRKIGGIYGLPEDHEYGVTYVAPITPRDTFDVMVFVAETTAARRNQPLDADPDPVARSGMPQLDLSGEGVPDGWDRSHAARRHPGVIVVSDEPSPLGGKTVCLSRDAPWRWGGCQLTQTLSTDTWHGRRLRFSAAARSDVAQIGSGALLFVRFLKERTGDHSDFFAAPLVTSASDPAPVRSRHWTSLVVEADVPDEAASVTIGLALTGNGSAWFGDLGFATVPRLDEISNTPMVSGSA